MDREEGPRGPKPSRLSPPRSGCCPSCSHNAQVRAKAVFSGASNPPANSLRKHSLHPCPWGEDQVHTFGHSKARARTWTPRFPHCTAALPWTQGQAHLLLLAISSLCLSIVSIKSRNWGQSQAEPIRAQSLLTPHGWQERRPTFTEAAGHQGAEPHPRRGWLPDREAQRGSPPTQLKGIRKEAASRA